MSSPSTTNVPFSSKKQHAMPSKAKSIANQRKTIKKATVSYSPSPSPLSDFTLYTSDAVVEKNSSERRARARRVREELISDGLLPSAKEDDEVPHERLTPLLRATKRRNKAEQQPIIHQSKEGSHWRDMRPPPAPSPPRLGTPDLDEIDEDLWSCCSWGESSVESYTAATKASQEMQRNNRVGV